MVSRMLLCVCQHNAEQDIFPTASSESSSLQIQCIACATTLYTLQLGYIIHSVTRATSTMTVYSVFHGDCPMCDLR